KSDERCGCLRAIDLQTDAPAGKLERAKTLDDSLGRWLRSREVRLQPELAQRARRLRAASDLSRSCELRHEGLAKRRLMLLDATQKSAQALAGENDEIVAAAGSEAPAPVQHGCRVRWVSDCDQRAAQDACAPPLEHGGEDFELARFGNGDRAAGKRSTFHHRRVCTAMLTR